MTNPANFRTPRGYDVSRPPYQEISEGVRISASMVPMEPWVSLPPVRIDELAHDPIVIEAGTVVGIATGGVAEGKLFPAWNSDSGGSAHLDMLHHSDGATWGLSATDVGGDGAYFTGGPVKPLGLVYQPIYSFSLQATHTNYQRVESVAVVTDYLVQIPSRTTREDALAPGDKAMVIKLRGAGTKGKYGHFVAADGSATVSNQALGTLEKYEFETDADNSDFVVGTVVQNLIFASDTGAAQYDTLDEDLTNVALSTAGAAEFKGLDRVQTVPGLGLAGSGTNGVPGWLLKARADGSGNFRAITLLVRL